MKPEWEQMFAMNCIFGIWNGNVWKIQERSNWSWIIWILGWVVMWCGESAKSLHEMLRVFEPQISDVFVDVRYLLSSSKGVLALTQTCSTIQLFGGVKKDATKKNTATTSFSAIWLSRTLMRSACSLGRVVGSPGISRSCSPGILVGSSKASCIHGWFFFPSGWQYTQKTQKFK